MPFGKFAFALLQPLLGFLTPFVRFFVSHIPRLIGQELKGGDAGEVFELARDLGKHVSAKLALNGKSQRGYDLLDNKQIKAARADKIELRHSMSPVEVFLVFGLGSRQGCSSR